VLNENSLKRHAREVRFVKNVHCKERYRLHLIRPVQARVMAKNPSNTSDEPSSELKPGADKKPVHKDQTEADSREQLIVELRDAVRARDDFLAVVAHELRNPLTPILLCVQLIREAEQSEDEVKASAELDRLERLIKHFVARTTMLLEVAQISSNKFVFKPSELNLSEVINGVVHEYMPMILRSGSELTTNIQSGVGAHLDELAVSGIVENLLSNAIKYGEHKPIELTLTATNDSAQLIVRDSGIGIDTKDKDRIFERFERVVGRAAQSGFGIGLWLVRNLVESMGGSITVIGKPGQGSLFTVTLPIRPRENR
jgi:two-component system, OmpR family, sensor kinase